MKARRITGLICAAVLGILAGFWGGSGTGEALFSLSTQAGEGLRALSLTGFLGNLSAWAIILAVSSLPLLLLKLPKGRGALTGTDTLLPLSSLLIFLALFFSVNPTLLSNPLPEYRILGAAGGALCALVCWLVLRLLEPLDRQDTADLARLLSALLTACALVLVFAVAFQSTFSLLTKPRRFSREIPVHPPLLKPPFGSTACWLCSMPSPVCWEESFCFGAVIWPASWSTSLLKRNPWLNVKKPPAAAVRSSRPPSCSPLEVIFSS